MKGSPFVIPSEKAQEAPSEKPVIASLLVSNVKRSNTQPSARGR